MTLRQAITPLNRLLAAITPRSARGFQPPPQRPPLIIDTDFDID
jgi:hypothetical protein